MTAEQYRKQARDILTSHRQHYPDSLRQAEIWAQLAVSAAISEQHDDGRFEFEDCAGPASRG